ncbi:molybdate ABC transporter substrate-binding protein [Oryzihumus leptocrescens]|uniref:Molybdate-binding protein ModA n=1 Tax=Oryzihumus leptocrescens TaxID=297536 RepID=A0A542Z7A6_9MICO|nr:molybdate ABC transporter substrate-binding protein [Oryzihumus leptocrescens]TQL56227.1 molybdate transport system substrate-binding protein [Oryzihumus leptocrescens]
MNAPRRSVLTGLAAGAVLALAACGTSGSSSATTAQGSSSSVGGTVTVFAAASLKEAFTNLGTRFEEQHPGTHVVFSFGPSSGLAQQVTQGAPADVFASASTKNMDQVVQAGAATTPTPFASNQMEIAVPPDNPAHVAGVKDLARSGVKVALCQAQVPCGATAAKVFDNAGVTVTPVTEEVDVKSVLAKVSLGEVDAGVVYVTDVRAAGSKVKGILIPAAVNASTSYPIATLVKAPNPAGAKAFTDLVLSAAGQQVLAADGFAKP